MKSRGLDASVILTVGLAQSSGVAPRFPVTLTVEPPNV